MSRLFKLANLRKFLRIPSCTKSVLCADMHAWINKRKWQLFPVRHNSSCFDLPKRNTAILGSSVKDDVSKLSIRIRGDKFSLTKMLCSRNRARAWVDSINDVHKKLGLLFDPLPLVHIWNCFVLQNSRNLPHYIIFSHDPLPPLMPTSYLEAPNCFFSEQRVAFAVAARALPFPDHNTLLILRADLICADVYRQNASSFVTDSITRASERGLKFAA